jgi:hypothetical protein
MPLYKKPMGVPERIFVGLLLFAMVAVLFARGYQTGKRLKQPENKTEKNKP